MNRRKVVFPVVLCVAHVCGCIQTANTPHQYEELKRLSRKGHRFSVSYSSDLPIGFQDFGISVVGPTNNTLGSQANMIVKGGPDALQKALRSKAAAAHPDKKDRIATALEIEFAFRQKDGSACGSERVLVRLESGDHVGITLRTIGTQGSPYSIVAKPTTIMWKWKAQVVSVPVGQ